jgi:hypothetical protein
MDIKVYTGKGALDLDSSPVVTRDIETVVPPTSSGRRPHLSGLRARARAQNDFTPLPRAQNPPVNGQSHRHRPRLSSLQNSLKKRWDRKFTGH